MSRIIPSYRLAKLGESVEFTCFSDRKATWKFKDGLLPNNVIALKCGIMENCLFIKNVNSKNAGTYSCYGQDNDLIEFVDWATLKINSKTEHLILYPLIVPSISPLSLHNFVHIIRSHCNQTRPRYSVQCARDVGMRFHQKSKA